MVWTGRLPLLLSPTNLSEHSFSLPFVKILFERDGKNVDFAETTSERSDEPRGPSMSKKPKVVAVSRDTSLQFAFN